MSSATAREQARPRLMLFSSRLSGRCRRVDGFLAQVLQRRANHSTFELERIDVEEQPELHESFGIDEVPTLVVVEEEQIRGRVVDPSGCKAIERFLAPWLH
ncbi:MAG TPA: thioredoxin family protein [Gaiellaceae bacterium]